MLHPGMTLDHDKYQIEAVIGRGGFGHVYRARERLTGETVAIKELVPSFVDDREMVQRFIQEARLTLRLSHPHIVRTYGIFQARGTYYLAMEFLSGGSLADRVERGPLPIAGAVRIAAELCKALEQAHQLEITHCDIKPANVLFDEQGRVHLTDFGIAHVSAELTTRHVVTASGTTMGTVRYMAPEQLEGVRDDPRVDVYAVGAVLYEMLAGRPYLDFETETSIAAQLRNAQRIQSEPPRPLRAVNPAVPEWLARVVNQALRKAPEDRFGTARQLRDALERTPDLRAAPRVPPARPAAPGDGWIARGAGWLKDLPVGAALTVAVAMVALLACGAIGLWMIRDASRTSQRTPTVTLKLTDLATAPALTSSPAPQSADLTGTSRSDEAQLALETPSEIPLSDSDNDGVPDDQDRCPDQSGSAELKGCPDSDMDGVPDLDDDCPTASGLPQFGGCPDSDEDGVPDPQDRCPDSFGSAENEGCLAPDPTELSPTGTPLQTCEAVTGPFAEVWSSVHESLGCATGPPVQSLIAEESFEGGKMFWREPIDDAQALVLYNDGTWKIYAHTPWEEGSPEFSCPDAETPSQCPPTPKRGFGAMWCDISEIRSRLGNATDCERGYQGSMQVFDRGSMLKTDTGAVYVFYDGGYWERR